jgi:hypothetical protein
MNPMDTVELYGYAAATVATAVISLWVVSVAIKDASIVDVFWGPLFVAIAWVLFALGLDPGAVGDKQLILLLVTTRGRSNGVPLMRNTSRERTRFFPGCATPSLTTPLCSRVQCDHWRLERSTAQPRLRTPRHGQQRTDGKSGSGVGPR